MNVRRNETDGKRAIKITVKEMNEKEQKKKKTQKVKIKVRTNEKRQEGGKERWRIKRGKDQKERSEEEKVRKKK